MNRRQFESWLRAVVVSALCSSVAACSDPSFATAPGTDALGDDTSRDASAVMDFGDPGPPDSPMDIGTAIDVRAETVPDATGADASDGGQLDASFDSVAEVATDTPGDTRDVGLDVCAPNPCGGCTQLPLKLGDGCGCGGKVECNGKEAVRCAGASTVNECGGCAALVGTRGAACSTCGMLGCAGKDSLVCESPTICPLRCAQIRCAPGNSCCEATGKCVSDLCLSCCLFIEN